MFETATENGDPIRFSVDYRNADGSVSEPLGWVPNLWDYQHKMPHHSWYEIEYMSPREFLARVGGNFSETSSAYRPNSFKHFEKALYEGKAFAPLQLWPHDVSNGITQHEGRHRALFFDSLGLTKVPVAIWHSYKEAKCASCGKVIYGI